MPTEVNDEGTLVYGYLDIGSPDRRHAADTVLVRSAAPFAADLRPQRFGALGACDISGEHGVRVSPHTAPTARTGALLLGLLLAGDGTLEQDGRHYQLAPGDLVIYAGERPFRLVLDDAYRWFVINLGPGSAEVRQAVGRELGQSPTARILASMLGELALRAGDLGPVTRTEIGEHVGGLVRTLARECGRPQASPDQALDRILEHIDRHLGEDLSPGRIAAAHHISVRSLHALFQRQGESVGGHIRRRRLDRIRRDLADPALAHVPAYAVAARWGIHDPSHFGKLFKAEYGVSPREFRRSDRGRTPSATHADRGRCA